MGEAIFRFLFKYPPVAYARGHLAFSSGLPGWLLPLLIIVIVAVIGRYLWRRHASLPVKIRALVWGLQAGVLAILLLLLWRPSLIVATQTPQQNVVAILADDSSSMAMADDGSRRIDQVHKTFDDSGPLLGQLREKFQIRLYRVSREAAKIRSVAELTAAGPSSHLQQSLADVYGELRHLPLAGVVIASDGAENGTPDSDGSKSMLDDLKARRIPVYTLGTGSEEFDRDVQIDDVSIPRAALPGSVVPATVTIRQHGYIGQSARLEIRDGKDVLKSREIQFGPSPLQTVPLNFVPKAKGLREYTVSISQMPAEVVRDNNTQSRLVEVQDRTARILYIEGEPRWEYKFIRRALDDDRSIHVVSLLKSSESKFYRQGIETPQELGETLPERKQLFHYDGLIIGSVTSSFFSPQQQEDIYNFVNRRGGGVLFLGGRYSLGDGGYQSSSLADLIPVHLGKPGGSSLRRIPAKFELTPRGFEDLQLSENETANREGWAKLPLLGNYQVTGDPKPGALVLAEAVAPDKKRFPVLTSQRFGRGRALLFATDGSWRWRMQLESANRSPETFWRQILHALVNEAPHQVSVTAEKPLYLDEQHVRFQAQVYDENYQPVNGAAVVATLHAPDGSSQSIPMDLSVELDGVFRGAYDAVSPGVYRLEVTARLGDKEIGKGGSYFQRADGGLEAFSAEQNKPFLTRLAEQTGGKYYPISRADLLPEQLTYSPAGISAPEIRDLWDMPVWLLALLILKGTEWALRKKWHTV
ncbi:MAG: hypothetical protein HYX72_05850 [Acidobacteria bacterium]|nr:hypothetical protein [Acidobacteriota bacterium]